MLSCTEHLHLFFSGFPQTRPRRQFQGFLHFEKVSLKTREVITGKPEVRGCGLPCLRFSLALSLQCEITAKRQLSS